MLAILILAQVTSATPAPTPAAKLGSASTAVSAKPKTLADVARERKEGKKGVEGGTFSVAGTSGDLVIPSSGHGGGGTGRANAPGWNLRVRNAEIDVDTARGAASKAAAKNGIFSKEAAAASQKLNTARGELNQAREEAKSSSR